MKTLKSIRTMIMILTSLLLVTAFQNCGGQKKMEIFDSTQALLAFFNYPYSQEPKFYGSINLSRQSGAPASLSSFKFIGAAAYFADPAQSVTYKVTIQNSSGVTVCPDHEGTLSAGQSFIGFDCVTPVNTSSLRIQLSVQAGGDAETLTSVYSI